MHKDVIVFTFDNHGLPNIKNCEKFDQSELFLVLRNKTSNEDDEYSTDSDYEERTGIKRKFVPEKIIVPDKLINIFSNVSEDKKSKMLEKIIAKISKRMTYVIFQENNEKIYAIIKINENIHISGIKKFVTTCLMNYYFRREVFKVKTQSEPCKFYTGNSAYNYTFSEINELIEYDCMIFDDKYKTSNLEHYNIITTRNLWIELLKEKDEKNEEKKCNCEYLL